MPRSLLNNHADLILGMVEAGATNKQIRDALLAKSVSTSLEGVRVWIIKYAPSDLLENRGPGRRKNPKPARLDFLPDHRDKMELPLLLEASIDLLLSQQSARLDAKQSLAEALIRLAKIPVDVTIPPAKWMLPAKALKEISDLELMLLTYALSDHHSDPPTHGTHAYRTWLLGLMRDAASMRVKINRGKNFCLAELG